MPLRASWPARLKPNRFLPASLLSPCVSPRELGRCKWQNRPGSRSPPTPTTPPLRTLPLSRSVVVEEGSSRNWSRQGLVLPQIRISGYKGPLTSRAVRSSRAPTSPLPPVVTELSHLYHQATACTNTHPSYSSFLLPHTQLSGFSVFITRRLTRSLLFSHVTVPAKSPFRKSIREIACGSVSAEGIPKSPRGLVQAGLLIPQLPPLWIRPHTGRALNFRGGVGERILRLLSVLFVGSIISAWFWRPLFCFLTWCILSPFLLQEFFEKDFECFFFPFIPSGGR